MWMRFVLLVEVYVCGGAEKRLEAAGAGVCPVSAHLEEIKTINSESHLTTGNLQNML